jgi:ABC-type branched-subunit amino acid transport system substrate-binding protein
MFGKSSVRKSGFGFSAIVAIAASGLAISACSSSPSSSTTTSSTKSSVVIASVEDLTGPNSADGLGAQAGALAAVKFINDSGEIDGHKLVVQTYDMASDPTTAEGVILKAESAKPAALTGALESTESIAAGSTIKSGDIPWVSASYPVPETNSLPFFFLDAPTGAGVAAGAVNAVKALLGGSLQGKKIAFEGLISPAVDSNLAAIESVIKQDGGTVGPIIRDPLTFTSWSSQASNVMAAKPAAVITNHDEPMTAIVAEALGVAGFKGPIVSTEGAASDVMLSAPNLPNFYAVRENVVPLPGSASYQAGITAGQSATNMSSQNFGKEFADVYVIAATLRKCGVPCSTSKFDSTLKALGNITVPDHMMAGPLNFSQGQVGLTEAQVWKWDPTKKASVPVGAVYSITS